VVEIPFPPREVNEWDDERIVARVVLEFADGVRVSDGRIGVCVTAPRARKAGAK
jgi:hypothetical protein